MRHPSIVLGCLIWAVTGLAIAASGLGGVNADARAFVWSAMVIGGGAAVVAARFAAQGRLRVAGWCLVVSALLPTWFAVWLNLVPLVGGLLLLAPRRPARAAVDPLGVG